MTRRVHTLIAVAAVSAALIAYEIVLMRRLVVEHWHHFAYLVISMALLGFGVSGTLLSLLERRVRRRPEAVMFWLAVSLLAALIATPRAAALLPVTGRFIPEDLWRQIGWWSLYWVTTLIPLLLGAAILGAALMSAGPQVGRVYAVNLFGSAVGAVLAVWFISRLVIEYSLWPSLLLACGAAMLLRRQSVRGGSGAIMALAVLALIAEWRWPLRPAYEEYKYGARLAQLAAQGSARRVARRADPHGYVELYESKLFHDLPFLALSQPPPPMYSLVRNGDPAGSILRVHSADAASVMDSTLMALPYRLLRPRPRVLLIGETGGADVWLARRRDAAQIDVVQPNAAMVALVREYGGGVLKGGHVRVITEDPRRFLARAAPGQYDLIQVVALEGLAVGNPGLRGLTEDTLVTVEGFAACLRVLAEDGVLAISRGVEEPARENIRLFATLVEALKATPAQPFPYGRNAERLVQVRDYLGVCTMARRSPLDEAGRTMLRSAIHELNLTPVWYAGLPESEVNRPDQLDGPPGTNLDWLAYADREILSPQRVEFYDSWLLNVRPVHDDDPFFWDFYKPGAIAALKRAYGDLWLTRAELGRLFLYASLVAAGMVGSLLIILPLVLSATAASAMRTRRSGTVTLVVYFGGIGLGFMGIEMALISRATAWVGDPIIASALVIGGMLVISGVGSLVARRVVGHRAWLAPLLVAVVAAVLWAGAWRVPAGGGGLRAAAAAAVAISWLMGMPMPGGLGILHAKAPRLIPGAWGVNGLASVIATSGALVVAMSAGYRTVVLLAAVAYALAAIAALRLGTSPSRPGRIIMAESGAAG
jgi:hypothetical protein